METPGTEKGAGPAWKWSRSLLQSFPRQAALLGAWVLTGLLAEGIGTARGLPAKDGVVWALAVLALLLLFVASRRAGFELLTSLSFAITQLAFLGLLALVGAFVTRIPGIHSEHLKAVLSRLSLLEPLPHLAPLILMVLLAATTLLVAWKRRPYRPSRIGFLLVHLAPGVLLIGALWNGFSGHPGGLEPSSAGAVAKGAGQIIVRAGWGLLLVGMAWMFYLKPPLKRRERGGAL